MNFHRLVGTAGVASLWIPAFAGMTMKAKAAGMEGSTENCHGEAKLPNAARSRFSTLRLSTQQNPQTRQG
jgi:hypothetical protein